MSSIWKLGGGKKEADEGSKKKKKDRDEKKRKKEDRKSKRKSSAVDDFVLSGPTNAQHLGHMGFDRKNGFEVRNLPPEWEALFKGLNETLKSLGAHGVTKKEAQMLFAMASDALVPGAASAPVAQPATAPRQQPVIDKQKQDQHKLASSSSDAARREKESEHLLREREALIKQRDDLLKEREQWIKGKDNAQKIHDENQQLFKQLQEEKKHRLHYESEHTQLTQRLRILDYELGQLKAQLSSKSTETESQSKRRDAEMLEMISKHEAIVLRKEQELTYERDYRSQLQVEKIELENQLAQLRAELSALKAQGINPSTALEEAKTAFDTELEGIKRRLEDDMNQTKQLLAYEQQCRAFYENDSREKESQVLRLRMQLEDQQSKQFDNNWEEEKAKLHEEFKVQQINSASETQKLLTKLQESTERTLALERQLKEAEEKAKEDLRSKEELYEAALKEKDNQLSDLKSQIQRQSVTVSERDSSVGSVRAPAPPPVPPPGPPPPGPPAPSIPSAPSAPPAAPAAPSPSNVFEAGSRDALLAAIKNPVLLKPVEAGKKKEEQRDVAAEDGNVLNIIARALLARRAAIKDDGEDEPEEDLWE